MRRKIFLPILGLFTLGLSACGNETTLHLSERNVSFKIYNYQINDGCISFHRDPKSKKGETICNEKFWIETETLDD